MTVLAALFKSIQSFTTGLTLAELPAQHPGLARRTVQRWLSQWSSEGQITTSGEGRARRYAAPALPAPASAIATTDRFPPRIPCPQTAATSWLTSINRCQRASRSATSVIFSTPTSPM